MWPFKRKPVEQTHIDSAPEPEKPAEKELPALEWELSIGPWHKEFRCEHCGHVWCDDAKEHDEDPCPVCGCIGSHKMQVIRYEHEHTQCFNTYDGTYQSFTKRGIELGRVDHPYGGRIWRGVRNEKTVIWDGCSVKKDSNDK